MNKKPIQKEEEVQSKNKCPECGTLTMKQKDNFDVACVATRYHCSKCNKDYAILLKHDIDAQELRIDQNMKIKTLYLMSHKMKWKTFKMLHDKLVNESGPVPMGVEKMLWQMLRDKQIYCWFCNEMKNDMGVGLELPEYEELEIIV